MKDVREGGSIGWGGSSKSRGFELSSLIVRLFLLDWLSRGLDNRGLKKCKRCILFSTSKNTLFTKPAKPMILGSGSEGCG